MLKNKVLNLKFSGIREFETLKKLKKRGKQLKIRKGVLVGGKSEMIFIENAEDSRYKYILFVERLRKAMYIVQVKKKRQVCL